MRPRPCQTERKTRRLILHWTEAGGGPIQWPFSSFATSPKIPASRAARQVSELIARAEPGSPLGQTAGSTGPQSQKKKAALRSGQELREVPSHAVRQHAGCAIGVNKLCVDHSAEPLL